MVLRIATPADQTEVESLLRLMVAEIGTGRVSELIAKGQVCLVLRNEKIVGTLGLDKSSFKYFSPALRGDWLFIDPAHRGDSNARGDNGGHASKLIAWAKTASDKCGIPLLFEMPIIRCSGVKSQWLRERMAQFRDGFVHLPRAV